MNILSFNVEGISLSDRFKTFQFSTDYLMKKKKLLHDFILSTGSDIICLQEFTLNLQFELLGYDTIQINDLAIMFNPKLVELIDSIYIPKIGLIGNFLHPPTGFIFFVATARWTPFKQNVQQRIESFNTTSDFFTDKTGIFIGDTNARNGDIESNDILSDAYEGIKEKSGIFTIDKKENPYFPFEPLLYQSRFDRCYMTNDIVCSSMIVCGKEKYDQLKPISASGCLSDHYALKVTLNKKKYYD